MKLLLFYTGVLLLFQSCVCIYGCDDDDTVDPEVWEYSQYDPILLERSEFESSIVLTDSKPIVNSGKIYVKDQLLFINEINEGFHVYDNSDPTNPKAINFLSIPGATDLAIRNSTFYVNQATDLIAVSFNTTSNNLEIHKRIANTFPELRSPDGYYHYSDPEKEIVVGWRLKEEFDN